MNPIPILIALTSLGVICAGFTIGLTFAPCYATYCVEQFFPFEARIHLAFFFALLASIAVALGLRACNDTARRISSTYISTRVVPIIDKRISWGGLALFLWIVGLTHATMGYWEGPQYDFWEARGREVNWTKSMARLAFTGITGHWCDISLGLVIIPVSRNSIIGNLFELHVSTLLFAHKLLAYGLLVYTIIHGGFYYVRNHAAHRFRRSH